MEVRRIEKPGENVAAVKPEVVARCRCGLA